MGPPGCGKGTQAEKLIEARKLAHVSTGNMLRSAIREGGDFGEKVASILEAGELVPDELMIDMMRRTLEAFAPGEGWLLDGFPRTAAQAESLIGMLTEIGHDVSAVISFEVPDDVIVGRLGSRLTCTACGFVTVRGDREIGDACPRCGEELAVRDDDRPETVRNRLRVFNETTRPAVEILAGRYALGVVDGTGTPQEVWQRVQSVLAD